jgi:DNA-binding NarL/FixJ family response regulator
LQSNPDSGGRPEHATDDVLTPEGVQLLRLFAGGDSNKQIADLLFVIEETAQGVRYEHPVKLDVNDRTYASTEA